jgi:hypothetical protein
MSDAAYRVGRYKGRQLAVTNGPQPENKEARAKAERMIQFMALSEKMAAVGPGRRELTTQEADNIIEAETVEPTTPELLREFEEQQEERAPSSVPINFD